MAVEGQRLMTKTQHYRKVTKPLLERKRRARMNLYLDELKDLIVDTMEAQGEHVNKLEKADILEMTVTYLKSRKRELNAGTVAGQQQQQQQQQPATPTNEHINVEKFRAGYTQAAYEVSKIFSTLPGLDVKFGTRLMKQLGHQLKDMRQQTNAMNQHAVDFDFIKPNQSYREVCAPIKQQQQHQQQQQFVDKQRVDPHGSEVWRPW